jgi:hypothetical protein
MTRILYSLTTLTTRPYPRGDEDPVIGLDRTEWRVLELIQMAPPPIQDGEILNQTEIFDWFADTTPEGVDGTLTRDWEVIPAPPPPVLADWDTFVAWLYQFQPIATGMGAARLSTDPQGEPATTGLPTALDEARLRQNYPAFALAWGLFLLASQMPPEALGAIVTKASQCHLPAEFLAALQPSATP